MSGLPAELVAQAGTSYDAVRISREGVFWIESRADGRDVLVRWTAQHGQQDVTPGDLSVASRVHEYGGGAWAVAGGTVWFCEADGQRLYRVVGADAIPVDPEPGQSAARYADLWPDPRGCHLWAVRERHEPAGVSNELVLIPVAPPAMSRVVASGWDFYSFPRPSRDGRRLAWTCWNAPLMPWDGTCLYVADVSPDGDLREPVLVAGGPAESVFQPQWSPGGVLHFISDRRGWWNLYARRENQVVPVLAPDAELGVAQWEFGYSTYAFLDHGRIAVIAQRGSQQSLEVVADGRVRQVPLPCTSIKPYLSAHGSDVALIASSAIEAPSVIVVDIDHDASRKVAGPEPVAEPRSSPRPEPFSFAARDGIRIHGLFHEPWQRPAAAPPLVVKAHPGPTANAPMRLDWHTQYLCSHGFAVAEIDYRGSTGYGPIPST